eukprot:363060-Chlamydomonas_euryale.AAC.1
MHADAGCGLTYSSYEASAYVVRGVGSGLLCFKLNQAYAEDVRNRGLESLRKAVVHDVVRCAHERPGGEVEHRVGDVAVGRVELLLHVDASGADERVDGAEHRGVGLVDHRQAHACASLAAQQRLREVDRVADGAGLEELLHGPRGHRCRIGVGKVGDVLAGQLARVPHVLDGLAVDDLAARKVEQVDVGLAHGQGLGVEHVVRAVLDVGHVHSDVVRRFEQVLKLVSLLHAVARQAPCSIHR